MFLRQIIHRYFSDPVIAYRANFAKFGDFAHLALWDHVFVGPDRVPLFRLFSPDQAVQLAYSWYLPLRQEALFYQIFVNHRSQAAPLGLCWSFVLLNDPLSLPTRRFLTATFQSVVF